MKKITVIVPRDGISTGQRAISIETSGFQGVGCVAATQGLQAALGHTVEDRPTAEQFEEPPQQEFLRGGE